MEMTSCGKKVESERQPPTERTAFFHSLWVHQQAVVWAKLANNALVPQELAWKLESNILSPIMTDLDPALENLLKFIRCKCKVSSRNPCGTIYVCAAKMDSSVSQHVVTAEEKHAITLKRLYLKRK